MNAIVKTESQSLSAEAMEHVLGTGDLSKLTVRQRVEYYGHVCRSLGLNPLTRPFRFMNFQGQTVLYATRDCTDQLRSLRKISVSIVDKQLDGDLFIVTARAETADHRRDEDVGAVTMGQLRGDARANAIMKAMTKAKRRVTMSICGMGFLDETEVETLSGAVTYDAEAEPSSPRNDATPDRVMHAPAPPKQQRTAAAWLVELRAKLDAATDDAAVEAIAASDEVKKMLGWMKNGALAELNAMLADAVERVKETPHDPETGDDTAADIFPGDR
jgi:hypothetical protein